MEYLNPPFELKGYWWLPQCEEKRIPGILTCDEQQEITLDLLGDLSGEISTQEDEYPFILGSTGRGDVTLSGNIVVNRSINPVSAINTSKIYAISMFIGVHFESETQLRFTELRADITHLAWWVGISGVSYESSHLPFTYSAAISSPDPLNAPIDDNLLISVSASSHSRLSNDPPSIHLSHRYQLRIQYSEEQLLPKLQTTLFRLSNFLSLAINDYVHCAELSLYTPNILYAEDKPLYKRPVYFYYKRSPNLPAGTKPNQLHMLFKLSDIKLELGNILSLWLSNYEALEPALNLYFATERSTQLYLENQFLNLAQGLETLHRRTTPNQKEMTEDEHLARVRSILEKVPLAHREWLERQLKYSNEPSLNTRIKDLLVPFEQLFGNNKERRALARTIVATRNFRTHYSPESEAEAVPIEELSQLIRKMKAIFIAHLLRIIGFEDDKIVEMVKGNQEVMFPFK
jgi:hypothetical protein